MGVYPNDYVWGPLEGDETYELFPKVRAIFEAHSDQGHQVRTNKFYRDLRNATGLSMYRIRYVLGMDGKQPRTLTSAVARDLTLVLRELGVDPVDVGL